MPSHMLSQQERVVGGCPLSSVLELQLEYEEVHLWAVRERKSSTPNNF